jgi:tryptophan-rich sensory protein
MARLALINTPVVAVAAAAGITVCRHFKHREVLMTSPYCIWIPKTYVLNLTAVKPMKI